jgi:hypothetical protein
MRTTISAGMSSMTLVVSWPMHVHSLPQGGFSDAQIAEFLDDGIGNSSRRAGRGRPYDTTVRRSARTRLPSQPQRYELCHFDWRGAVKELSVFLRSQVIVGPKRSTKSMLLKKSELFAGQHRELRQWWRPEALDNLLQ